MIVTSSPQTRPQAIPREVYPAVELEESVPRDVLNKTKPAREVVKLEVAKPKELSESTLTSPQIEKKETTNLGKDIARSIFDSTFRGIIRYFESLIDNQFLRVPYRLVSETARKTSEIVFLNILDKKKAFSLNDLENGGMRALEHGPATLLIEPSFYEGSIPRVLAGLGNMTVRFISRLGLSKVNPSSHEALNEKNILDEFLSRSLFRVIPVNFDNPVAGIGMRILEQLGIDLNLHVIKPFSRLFPESTDFLKDLNNAPKDLTSP